MGGINAAVTGFFDLVLWPFRGLSPVWGLTAVSFVTGIIMLWIFGRVSNQDAIRTVRDRIRGNLIGIRLFGDDLGMLFRLQGRILRQTARYAGHALLPMLVLLPPVLLILVQLNLRFSVQPLEPGERAVVKAKLAGLPATGSPVELQAPEGVVVETPGVRIDALREVAWRIRAERPGDYRLVVRAGAEPVEKTLHVGGGWRSVSAKRTGENLWEMLLWPGEPPVDPASGVEAIEVQYRTLPVQLLFFNVNGVASGWLIFFFVASVVFGYAFKGVLGVEV